MITRADFIALAVSASPLRAPSGGKALIGMLEEDFNSLISNKYKVMGVDDGGSGSFDGIVSEWDRSSISSISAALRSFVDERAKQQRATMWRRDMLLKLRFESGFKNITIEQLAGAYYDKMNELGLVDYIRP